MGLPYIKIDEATGCLAALSPLLCVDVYAVVVSEGPGGWAITIRATQSRATSLMGERLGLAEAPDRATTDDQYAYAYSTGRRGRVGLLLVATRHTVTRVNGRATLSETR